MASPGANFLAGVELGLSIPRNIAATRAVMRDREDRKQARAVAAEMTKRMRDAESPAIVAQEAWKTLQVRINSDEEVSREEYRDTMRNVLFQSIEAMNQKTQILMEAGAAAPDNRYVQDLVNAHGKRHFAGFKALSESMLSYGDQSTQVQLEEMRGERAEATRAHETEKLEREREIGLEKEEARHEMTSERILLRGFLDRQKAGGLKEEYRLSMFDNAYLSAKQFVSQSYPGLETADEKMQLIREKQIGILEDMDEMLGGGLLDREFLVRLREGEAAVYEEGAAQEEVREEAARTPGALKATGAEEFGAAGGRKRGVPGVDVVEEYHRWIAGKRDAPPKRVLPNEGSAAPTPPVDLAAGQ